MLPERMPLTTHHMGPCMSKTPVSGPVTTSKAQWLKESLGDDGDDALVRKGLTETYSRMSQDLAPSREVATIARIQHTARHSSAHGTSALM